MKPELEKGYWGGETESGSGFSAEKKQRDDLLNTGAITIHFPLLLNLRTRKISYNVTDRGPTAVRFSATNLVVAIRVVAFWWRIELGCRFIALTVARLMSLHC